MAHGRDKPGREKRKAKKVKAPASTTANRDQQVLTHVAGQDQHRWTTDQRQDEP